jgi:hypothetical protein
MAKHLLLFPKMAKNRYFRGYIKPISTKERIRQDREAEATAGTIVSQSVKKASLINLNTGIDGNKKSMVANIIILVDTLGLPLAIFVCAAHIQDGIVGIELLPLIDKSTKQLKLIRADKAYRSDFTEAAQCCGYTVEVSQKPPNEKGFIPQKDSSS